MIEKGISPTFSKQGQTPKSQQRTENHEVPKHYKAIFIAYMNSRPKKQKKAYVIHIRCSDNNR